MKGKKGMEVLKECVKEEGRERLRGGNEKSLKLKQGRGTQTKKVRREGKGRKPEIGRERKMSKEGGWTGKEIVLFHEYITSFQKEFIEISERGVLTLPS